MASLLELSGLSWWVTDFNTLSRLQKTLDVTIPYRGSKGALQLLVDSTGINSEGEGKWHTRKHGGSKRRVWRKIHLGTDAETLEIRAVEVTSNNVGDAPILQNLLAQKLAVQEIATVTADGAYDARACHDSPPERKVLEAGLGRRPRAQRDPAGVEESGSSAVAELEWVPPAQQRRNQNELRETARPSVDLPGLRPPGCRGPDPRGGTQPPQCTRHPGHRDLGISVSGERGNAVIS